MKTHVPETWVIKPLEEVALVEQGQSPPGSSYNTVGIGLPFFQGKAEFGSLHPSPVKWCTEPKKQAQAGDVLISIRAPVGPTNLAPTACCIGRGLAAVRPYAGPSEYLLHYLRYSVSRLVAVSTGTTFDAIGGAKLRAHRVPVPPTREQQRIVEAIDSYFSRFDDAVATLKRVQAKLKAYRASVLKAAVEGRLVPTEADLARAEKRDYEPADVLLKRILAERRRRWEEAELAKLKARGQPPKDDKWKAKYVEPVAPDTSGLPELPEGWCWATVDQLLSEPLANGKSVPDGDGTPVLRLTCIGSGVVNLDARKTGEWGRIDPASYLVKKNDFLIVRGNGSLRLVGRGGRVLSEPDRVAYPDTLIRVRLSTAALNPALTPRWWDSPPVRRHIETRAKTTAGIHKVNQGDVAETPIPLPPYNEQDRILDELERLDSVATAATHDLAPALARCSRLRQAVLKWAFEGKLVDQDPNDEPAQKLLERIRAERKAAPPAKTTKKKAGRKPKKVPA
jgi:type I restriction enzyme, S subunit